MWLRKAGELRAGNTLSGIGDLAAGVGKDNPHSTGDAETSLGHTVQIPLLPKEMITVLCPIYPEESALAGG